MNATDIQNLLFGTLQGVVVAVVAAVVVLGLLIGVCVLFGLSKLRPSGPKTRVVRSLDEAVGTASAYLTPDSPRGPVDQLRTPELLEAAARKTS